MGGVAGGDAAAGVEDGFEGGEFFERGVAPGAFVDAEVEGGFAAAFVGVEGDLAHGHGDAFVGEAAGVDGGGGALVAGEGEGVLVFARDVMALGDVFRGESHGEVGVGLVVHEARVERGAVAEHGDLAHALGAAGDDEVGHAALDALGADGDGFEAGGAEAVDGDGGHVVGEAGAVGGEAGEVEALRAFGHGAAEDEVVDLGGLEAGGAAEEFADDEGGEVVGADGAEFAARGASDGGAGGGDDEGVGHGDQLRRGLPVARVWRMRARVLGSPQRPRKASRSRSIR